MPKKIQMVMPNVTIEQRGDSWAVVYENRENLHDIAVCDTENKAKMIKSAHVVAMTLLLVESMPKLGDYDYEKKEHLEQCAAEWLEWFGTCLLRFTEEHYGEQPKL